MDLKDVFRYEDGRLFWKILAAKKIKIGDEAGNLKSDGYWAINFQYKKYVRHRVIYFIHTGEWPSLVDHINRDITDDRIENLRAASKSLNTHNSTFTKGAVPFRGVCLDKQRNRYRSEIEIEGKRIVLGRFDTPEEASAVYEKQKQLRTAHLM